MSQLKPVTLSGEALHSTTLYPGHRYYIENQDTSVLNSTHGVIGAYRITAQCAEIVPITPVTPSAGMNSCFFWDSDIDFSNMKGSIRHSSTEQPLQLTGCHLKNNRLLLNGTSLAGPEVTVCNDLTLLTLTPRFDVTFVTDNYAAQLGIIHLVQSTRFITLENGNQIPLLDTSHVPSPVLYLENRLDDQPIKLITVPQETGITREHSLTTQISQLIQDEIGGVAIATVTVLEQYHSYFMQCEVPVDATDNAWVPVFAPISWGWSIRVGRRPDGEWDIMRRKLMLPTTGHEGLQLPTWNNNSAACSPATETGI